MFTVCPKCALTLVVTAADLRVAQGYVRCGRCSSVFNALARLTDERQAAALEQPPAPVDEPPEPPANPTQSTAPAQESDDDLTDDALEFDPTRTDASAVFVEPPPNPQWTAAAGTFKSLVAGHEPPREPQRGPQREPSAAAQVDVEMDADFLASMLDDSPQEAKDSTPKTRHPSSEPPARPPAERTPSAVTSGAAATSRVAPTDALPRPQARHAASHTRPAQAAVKTPPASPRSRTPPAGAPPSDPPQEPDNSATHAADLTEASAAPQTTEPVWSRMLQRLGPRAWTVGAVLAALLLLGQIINHDRDELAASARFNRPLTALYSALGVQLTPHWDLHAYDVRQLGASVAPGSGGLITVRASIKNSARQAQPLPLLRVTLQDRFGNRIAARDVAPRFYLPHSMPASSFLSGGQRIDAEMGFVDPGANAVGFEIDACLPASGGGVACANDSSAR